VEEGDDADAGVVGFGRGTPRPVGRLGGHDAAPAAHCLFGNVIRTEQPPPGGVHSSDMRWPGELVLLAAERTVAVTREEHHQDVLGGRHGRMAVALQPRPSPRGSTQGSARWRSRSMGGAWAS
jgi:hypothetical protein